MFRRFTVSDLWFWTNTFCNLNKYSLNQSIVSILFYNSSRTMFQRPLLFPICDYEQIHFASLTNTFCKLNKYILHAEQIHFAILTNIFCNFNKFILNQSVVGATFWRTTFQRPGLLFPTISASQTLDFGPFLSPHFI